MTQERSKVEGWEAPKWLRRALLVAGAVVLLVVLVLAFRSEPVSVDLATVSRGTVEVAVEEDGRTRVRDRYELAAPVAGLLRRIEVEPGFEVAEGEVLARIDAPEAQLSDPRTSAQLRTRIEAARARVEGARAQAEAAEAATVETREEVRRQEILMEEGAGSESALERARAALRAREAEARSAEFAVEAAEGEVRDLELALSRPEPGPGGTLQLRAPVDGVVLRVHRESGGAVSPGEVLLELGDPDALELVVDLLSQDAVRVRPGHVARVTRWGGEEELPARVRLVEPAGFTRTSALGIEEQRVNVVLDLVGDGAAWERLGDGFRVEVRILLEQASDVIRVPAGALFRRGDEWGAFRAVDGRLEEVTVRIGRRSQAEVEVVGGLEEGDRVVVYPSDRVEEGARFEERSGT